MKQSLKLLERSPKASRNKLMRLASMYQREVRGRFQFFKVSVEAEIREVGCECLELMCRGRNQLAVCLERKRAILVDRQGCRTGLVTKAATVGS